MNKLEDGVKTVCDLELRDANEIHALFASDHDGAGVIREELEELKDAMDGVEAYWDELWDCIKNDRDVEAYVSAGGLYDEAIHAAMEAIQVAAMAQKFTASQDARNDKGRKTV